ncbi:MAG: universal stress protein [Chloroflexi bacterium]|nr:universal stress protein [Chloroflexota bacterium]
MELVRVIEEPHPEPSNPSYTSYLEHMTTTLQSETAKYLQELAESLRAEGVAVSWNVKLGNPATVIGELADSKPSTLIAMCSHGRSGQSRWWLGSTTDKVIHAAASAVLVVRTQSQHLQSIGGSGFKSCIAPLDGSVRAEQVLPHVVAWAKAFSLRVNLIRVIPELDSHTLELFPEASSDDRVSQANEYLDAVKVRLLEQGIPDVEVTVERGHPANVLVDLAHNSSESLMIMGTQGLGSSGVYRWTMGSVSQRVAGNSPTPVLVVRTQEEDPADLD